VWRSQPADSRGAPFQSTKPLTPRSPGPPASRACRALLCDSFIRQTLGPGSRRQGRVCAVWSGQAGGPPPHRVGGRARRSRGCLEKVSLQRSFARSTVKQEGTHLPSLGHPPKLTRVWDHLARFSLNPKTQRTTHPIPKSGLLSCLIWQVVPKGPQRPSGVASVPGKFCSHPPNF
jgi:hypothetical protein